MGEDDIDFEFEAGGGKCRVRKSDEQLTPYGGIVAWDHFLEHCGVLTNLANDYPLRRCSPNATPVKDIIKAFALNCVVGGVRFAHIRRLQDDSAMANIMGLVKARLCGEDAFRRLCEKLDGGQVSAWFRGAENFIYHAIPGESVADWDSTVVTRYGAQEDAEIGYNARKPGRPSHHPLACVIGGTRLCLHMEWRKGNASSCGDWLAAMEKVWANPIAQHRIKLNRGDIGFGTEAIMAWHEQVGRTRPAYLFKLKMTANVKRAIARLSPADWSGNATAGLTQVAEVSIKLHGWSCERRVVIERLLKPVNADAQTVFWQENGEDFSVYATNLSQTQATAFQVVQLYRRRGDAENVFDELKNQWGFAGFCANRSAVTQSAARLLLLTYNLWSMFVRVLKHNGAHTEALTSRYQLLLIAAKLTLSGRSKCVKLSLKRNFAIFLKRAYLRLLEWLRQTAPQLHLTADKPPPWLLFDPTIAPAEIYT